MLTWAIAYAIAHGNASQWWLAASMLLDAVIVSMLVQIPREVAKYKSLAAATSPLFSRVDN